MEPAAGRAGEDGVGRVTGRRGLRSSGALWTSVRTLVFTVGSHHRIDPQPHTWNPSSPFSTQEVQKLYSTPLLFNRTPGQWLKDSDPQNKEPHRRLHLFDPGTWTLLAFCFQNNLGMLTSRERPDLLQGSRGEKRLFIHDEGRNNFPTSPFILQPRHKLGNHLVFLAKTVKNKTLAKF